MSTRGMNGVNVELIQVCYNADMNGIVKALIGVADLHTADVNGRTILN